MRSSTLVSDSKVVLKTPAFLRLFKIVAGRCLNMENMLEIYYIRGAL